MHNERSIHVWYVIVLLVTASYLCVELSFSSELLHIISSDASMTRVLSIERAGRLISGFALGLVFWSFLTPKLFGKVKTAFLVNAVVTIICMVFAWHVEKNMVNGQEGNDNGVFRKTAVYASFIRSGLLDGTIALKGFPDKKEVFHTAYGKTFIALSPLLTNSTPDLHKKIIGVIPSIVGQNIRISVQGPQGYFNKVFLPSANGMKKLWSSYLSVVLHRPAMVAEVGARKWVKKVLSYPGSGPINWNAEAVHSAAQFYAQPSLQRYWWHTMHLSDSNVLLMPNMQFTVFRHTVWPVFLEKQTKKAMKKFDANSNQYTDGHSLASSGKNAVLLLTIPALALVLSIAFTMVHTSKTTYYLIKTVYNKASNITAIPTALGVSVLFLGLFYFSSTSITQSPLYAYLSQHYMQGPHIWPVSFLTVAIQAEQYLYPLAEFLRIHLLSGYTF